MTILGAETPGFALLARLVRVVRHPKRALRMALQGALFKRWLVHSLAMVLGPRRMGRLAARTLDAVGHNAARESVLVLDRLYFSKDIDVLRARGKLGYITLHTHVLSITQEAWLPAEAQVQVDYVAASGLLAEVGWISAEAYARTIIEAAQQRYGIRAVLASNVDYWQHEGFRRACTAMGLPFLVLCQELQTVRSVYEDCLKIYEKVDFRYSGTSVAVFGQATADMLIESKCCTPDQVVVTGAPRLDPWLNGETPDAVQDSITLLAFEGEMYLAPNCFVETLLAFAEASLRPEASRLRFVLKAKDAEDAAKTRAHLNGRPHRLVITHDVPLTELFPRSRLVIGYLSIAVMEALFSAAAVAVPQWGDAAKPAREQNLDPGDPDIRQHVAFLDGVSALHAAIDRALVAPPSGLERAARADLVWRWFHNPGSGGATARTEAFIVRAINSAQAASAARKQPAKRIIQ